MLSLRKLIKVKFRYTYIPWSVTHYYDYPSTQHVGLESHWKKARQNDLLYSTEECQKKI